jgi:hypothetical protein
MTPGFRTQIVSMPQFLPGGIDSILDAQHICALLMSGNERFGHRAGPLNMAAASFVLKHSRSKLGCPL